MSKEYDNYLNEHIDAVNKAARWMLWKLPVSDELTNKECIEILGNVAHHDKSKYGADEYYAYDAYFYGEKDEDAFNQAWLHHIHVNEHHWPHWVLVTDDREGDEKIVSLEMPKANAFEMVADWWSFSWRSGNLGEVFDWYVDHKDRIFLHPSTRAYVERILGEIKERISGD